MLGRLSVFTIVALSIAAGIGCGKKAAPPPPAPAAVTVSRPVVRDAVQWDEYSGNLSSPDMSNVVARVSGLIIEAPFREGAIVKKGDLLFVIDPRPYQADLDAKKAAVAQAQSQADEAEVHFRRFAAVRGTRAVSEDDYDAARAANQQAQSALAAAKAALESSQLNLEWTRVQAPISGKISRQYVLVGNLVNGGSGAATLLTTINSFDPLYCYVQVPANAALRYEKLAAGSKGASITQADIPCFIQVPGDEGFSRQGKVDFVDNQVETGTGTVAVRGVVPNPNSLLLPGLNVRMRIPASAPHPAVLIPDAAINADQNEQYVLTVGPGDVVRRNPVEPGALFGDLRAIDSGISANDLVIVYGVQKAQAGAKVNPHETRVSMQEFDRFEATGSGSPATQPVVGRAPESAPSTQPSRQLGPTTQPAAEASR